MPAAAISARVTTPTVKIHGERILAKPDYETRTAAARTALEILRHGGVAPRPEE